MRFSVTPQPQSALFRRMRISSPGQTSSRLTQKRILCPLPHGKAHSVLTASRKSAVCMLGLTERRTLSPLLPQSASFREIVPPECAFPYGTGCRMRFSVECAFPHLGKRRAASRKSAVCTLGLTQKRILHVGPHGKVQSAPSTSRKSAVCARAVAQNAPFREVRPQAEVRDPGATRPAAWRAVARARLPSWAIFHSAPHPGGRLPCAPLRAAT